MSVLNQTNAKFDQPPAEKVSLGDENGAKVGEEERGDEEGEEGAEEGQQGGHLHHHRKSGNVW